MDEKQFNILCKKVDMIVILLAMQNVGDRDKKIKALKNIGASSAEIGGVLGVEESVIRKSKGWKR